MKKMLLTLTAVSMLALGFGMNSSAHDRDFVPPGHAKHKWKHHHDHDGDYVRYRVIRNDRVIYYDPYDYDDDHYIYYEDNPDLRIDLGNGLGVEFD